MVVHACVGAPHGRELLILHRKKARAHGALLQVRAHV